MKRNVNLLPLSSPLGDGAGPHPVLETPMNVREAFKDLNTGQLQKLLRTIVSMLQQAEAAGSEKDRQELSAVYAALTMELQGRGL